MASFCTVIRLVKRILSMKDLAFVQRQSTKAEKNMTCDLICNIKKRGKDLKSNGKFSQACTFFSACQSIRRKNTFGASKTNTNVSSDHLTDTMAILENAMTDTQCSYGINRKDRQPVLFSMNRDR